MLCGKGSSGDWDDFTKVYSEERTKVLFVLVTPLPGHCFHIHGQY